MNDEHPDLRSESPADLELCERALAAARRESEERWQSLLRVRADLENVRKRTEREKAEAHRYATGRLIEALLPVKDSLELGLAAGEAAADAAGLRQGMRLTLEKLESVLAEFGVETVDPHGEPFDPQRHEAIGVEPAGELPANAVSRVHQKGYLLHGRLLRPAAVTVAQAEAGSAGRPSAAASAD